MLGGVLVDTTGWQGLFWIDAAIAAACVPLTRRTVAESRDPDSRARSTTSAPVLVALTLGPVVLALSDGNDWGWASAATLGCLGVALASGIAFVRVESRVTAPLVDLHLLRNRVRVGATLAILIVAGTINGLMYVLSLYFQDPSALGVSALGFGLAVLGFGALVFVDASWEYAAFLAPLIVLSVGLGIANGPASSGSTAAVPADQVGQASGISNLARYVGAAVAVAAVAMINNAVAENHRAAGDSAAEALAAGLAPPRC